MQTIYCAELTEFELCSIVGIGKLWLAPFGDPGARLDV